MYQFWTLFWRVSVQDMNSVFVDIDATHPDLMETYSILSVRKMASTAEDWHQLYMCKRGKKLG